MSRLRTLGWRTLVIYGVVALLVNSLLPAVALGAPIVGIVSPTEGAVVSAKTSIDVAFRSDSQRPITCLEIYVDDALARSWKLTTPKLDGKQSFVWDFTFATATTHRIAARAIDSANQAGTATITVAVRQASTVSGSSTAQGIDNIPPVVSIYYPAQGAHLSKTTEIKADATDNVGVKSVFLYIDGNLKTIIINAPPFVDKWDTTRVGDGPHVLQAKALDAAENEGVSSEVTVIVENHNMTTLQSSAPQIASVVPQGATATDAAPPVATAQAPVVQAPVIVVPGPSAPQTNDQQVARGLNAQSFGSGPAPVADKGAYELSVARPLAASSEGAALTSATRVASLAGSHVTLPDGVASTPLAVAATTQRGDLIASGWAGGLLASAMPQSAIVGQIARVSEPGTSVATVGAPGGDRPGEIVEPAGIGERYAVTVGSRTSAPEAQSLVAPTGQRAEIETEQRLIAALPASTSDGLTPQRTSMPGTSVIRPTQESASALLDRPGVLYVQPVLVLHPQAQVAVPGGAAPKSTQPSASATTPKLTGAASTATPAQAPLAVAPKAAASARQSARLAMLPRTEGERITIPGQPSGPLLATTTASEVSVRNLRVLFDNKELAMRAQPELRAGIPMTALREIFQKMDGVLYWYPVTKQVRAVSDKADISLRVGSKHATVNKQATTLQIAPYIKCGRTMVPLQFIADTLDVTVSYNPKSGQIVISNNKL